jgi:hypothetical protein
MLPITRPPAKWLKVFAYKITKKPNAPIVDNFGVPQERNFSEEDLVIHEKGKEIELTPQNTDLFVEEISRKMLLWVDPKFAKSSKTQKRELVRLSKGIFKVVFVEQKGNGYVEWRIFIPLGEEIVGQTNAPDVVEQATRADINETYQIINGMLHPEKKPRERSEEPDDIGTGLEDRLDSALGTKA